MKGASRSAKVDDASTAGSEATEEHSETPEPNGSGLSRCSRFRFE